MNDVRESTYQRLISAPVAAKVNAIFLSSAAAFMTVVATIALIRGELTLRQAMPFLGIATLFVVFSVFMLGAGNGLRRLAKHHRAPPIRDHLRKL